MERNDNNNYNNNVINLRTLRILGIEHSQKKKINK